MKLLMIMGILFSLNTTFAEVDFSLTSWNLGLAHTYVRYATERTPHIINSLQNYDSDVVCIQELWDQKDIDLIKASVKDKYPHFYSMPLKQKMSKSVPACGLFTLFGYKSVGLCLIKNCMKKEGDALTDCVLNTCGTAIERLKVKDKVCAEALFSQVGKSFGEGVLSIINPFKRVGLFTYQGSNGLAIMSKYPLEDVAGFNMDEESSVTRRSALYAKVKINGKYRHVGCTHLSADLKNVPYVGKFESWADESYHQAVMMTAFIEEKAQDEPLYLTGDFNCSYEDLSKGFTLEAPLTCNFFKDNGFFNKMLENQECTFCSFNTLITDEWEESRMLDHVFVKNVDTSKLSSGLIMKDLVTIKDAEGNDIQSNLSDHFGVRLETSK